MPTRDEVEALCEMTRHRSESQDEADILFDECRTLLKALADENAELRRTDIITMNGFNEACRQRDAAEAHPIAAGDGEKLPYEELAIAHGQQVTVTFKDTKDAFALFNELKTRGSTPPLPDTLKKTAATFNPGDAVSRNAESGVGGADLVDGGQPVENALAAPSPDQVGGESGAADDASCLPPTCPVCRHETDDERRERVRQIMKDVADLPGAVERCQRWCDSQGLPYRYGDARPPINFADVRALIAALSRPTLPDWFHAAMKAAKASGRDLVLRHKDIDAILALIGEG